MKNKNRFIYLFLLTFSCFFIYGQNASSLNLSAEADSLQSKDATKALLIRSKLLENKNDENYYYFKAKYEINKSSIANEKGDLETALIHIKAAVKLIPKFRANQSQLEFASEIYNSYYLTSGMSGDWEQALKIAIKCYDFTVEKLPKDEVCIDYLKDIGYIHNQLRNYSESILSYEKALKLIQKLQPKNYAGIALTHNGLGIGYSDSHFHTQSLYHYEKELEFLKKAKQADNSYIVQALNNVIWENLSYGDQKKAQNFADYLNKNFKKWYNEEDFSKINTPPPGKSRKEYFKMIAYLCNLRIEANKKNISNTKAYYDSIEYVFQKLPEDLKKRDYQPYLFARNEYVKLFEFDKKPSKKVQQEQINFNKESILLAKEDKSQHEELVAIFLLAKTYYKYEMYPEAIASIEESKKIAENFFNASRFTIQVLEAKVLQKTNKNAQAREAIKLAFEKLLDKKLTYTNLEKFSYGDFKKFNRFTFINNTINAAKVQELIYEKTKNKEDLLTANNLYFLASDMFAEFYRKGKYNYSLNNFNQSIASGLLQTQLLIDPKDQKKIKEIINRIENNSSQHLWNLFEVKNKQNLKVPANLIRHLNELVFEKNNLKEQIENSKETIELKNQLTIIEKEITKTQTAINQIDPSFQKFKSADFSIDATQKKLLAIQLVLKYVVTDDKVFAFSIQKETIKLVNLGNKEDLRKVVNDYNKQIRTIDNSFPKNASYLYDKLVHPLLESKSVSSIVFIPEDFLATVSFESLKDKKGQLVVQNFRTSYAYSIKLWNILKEKNNVSKQMETIATFAPNYSKLPPENLKRGGLLRAGLYDLADAKKEARVISELFNGKLYENQDANRDNFLKSTTNYSLHHLAMHSQLEQEYSKSALVFANNKKVYFDELYEINFPSNLVVLSACNTGIGINENGEGIMSLSRALTYAGVKSSVYSLWQVPDKETSEIMISFYENLKKGQPKDEALANSKKDFIKNNPMKTQPFYWAGFVVNGDVSPIMSSNNWLIYIGIGLGILILVVVFWKKKHFNSINKF
jgi:CHAT domain-containing protein/tetratricopeptide (TPR) repeat protein